MIAVVWFLSFAISCPLLFGLNNTGKRYTSQDKTLPASQTSKCIKLKRPPRRCLPCSQPRRHHVQLCRSGLRGVLVRGLLLRPLHRHVAGVCADLRGAAQTRQAHGPAAQTRPACAGRGRGGRRSPAQEGRVTRLGRLDAAVSPAVRLRQFQNALLLLFFPPAVILLPKTSV